MIGIWRNRSTRQIVVVFLFQKFFDTKKIIMRKMPYIKIYIILIFIYILSMNMVHAEVLDHCCPVNFLIITGG